MQFSQTATLSTIDSTHTLSLCLAKGLWRRFRGLMFAAPLKTAPATQALLITRCPSVHGFFMRYPIDVVYLATKQASSATQRPGQHYSVTHTATLKPWRVSMGKSHVINTPSGRQTRRSAHALELPVGSVQRLGIAPGDQLVLQP